MIFLQYKLPTFKASAFTCPHCSVYTTQTWHQVLIPMLGYGSPVDFKGLLIAICFNCQNYTLWQTEKMIYPENAGIPLPNPDLSEEIKEDYYEARKIVNRSPRGAAALLRVAIQKLCIQLKQPGKDLNADIANLVKGGLPPTIQQSLDAVRVIGNEAVHPGVLNLKDDMGTAVKLFELINIIVETMITVPKKVKELYDSLPQNKIDQIAKRDSGD